MELCGITISPNAIPRIINVHLLAAGSWFIVMALGGGFCLLLTLYLLVFTSYWWIVLPYLIWTWFLDNHTSEQGGRRSQWVRSWKWWDYFCDYFPVKFECVEGVQLSAYKNYLFCCFPHGVIPAGPFAAFVSNKGGFKDLFPHHEPYVCTLRQNFYIPLFRELCLAIGAVSASAKSIEYLLSSESCGNVVALAVGGAAEAYYCRPRRYEVVLQNRKGFVRLALRNGSPLVPVISFGEAEVFDQVGYPDGSLLHRCQEAFRRVAGVAPVIPRGSGFLGLIPRKTPITCLVGNPINVEKIEDPTQEEVDQLHEKFVIHLTSLFEENKHRYLQNADKIHLVIH